MTTGAEAGIHCAPGYGIAEAMPRYELGYQQSAPAFAGF
jgi:hypothetical protein